MEIVVHGAIDGYSRVIPYLKASGNNRADTSLSGFLSGIEHYGLPSRVRTDKGGENVLIAEYMLRKRFREGKYHNWTECSQPKN